MMSSSPARVPGPIKLSLREYGKSFISGSLSARTFPVEFRMSGLPVLGSILSEQSPHEFDNTSNI